MWSHLYRNKEDLDRFMMGMHSFSVLSAPHICESFDLSKFRRAVDLGGATGALSIVEVEI